MEFQKHFKNIGRKDFIKYDKLWYLQKCIELNRFMMRVRKKKSIFIFRQSKFMMWWRKDG